jgi:hypothetical protein
MKLGDTVLVNNVIWGKKGTIDYFSYREFFFLKVIKLNKDGTITVKTVIY